MTSRRLLRTSFAGWIVFVIAIGLLTLARASGQVVAAEGVVKQLDAVHDAVVALFSNRGLICSGVVIAPRVVLTARHCRTARFVRVGSDAIASKEIRTIVEFRSPPSLAVDAGLAVVDRAMRVAGYGVPAASDVHAPRQVRIVGFGQTDARASRGNGQRRYWDTRTRGWGCDYATSSKNGCIPGLELVLPRDGGNDTCRGDSGGPVLEESEDGWRVIAITSRAVRDSILPCGDGGIYVRTDRLRDWLDVQLKEIADVDDDASHP